MLFCSQQFLVFFTAVFVLYWALPWPRGRVYLLLSSDSDLGLFSALIVRARLEARLVAERSIFIESLIIYELVAR